MHVVVVVLRGGLVVVVVVVVVVVGGGGAARVVVVVGAAGVVVDDPATLVVPGVSTSETGAGVVVTERWEAHVVGMTAPPGRVEDVVDGVLGTGGGSWRRPSSARP